MAPYRTHRATDYKEKKHGSYLSRARIVMATLETMRQVDEPHLKLSKMNIAESRVKFASGFDKLCTWLSPSLSTSELDLRHNGDAMYVSFYDRILRRKKKRKVALIQPGAHDDD